jgi:hypothetical protein
MKPPMQIHAGNRIGIRGDQTWSAAEFWQRYDKGESK